ncbi:hypothetical protein GRZ55_10900 [Chelativorans sp. ZYF759]|uniref:hypothetical protein n=1 Tax=Chelativorans sp. ZYF759 TaxID=2692213 RepID=UPI00145E46AD|nr:hypothetical protein [Chelativorans sp. ZYF759]NMG39750.1 hypothetical protein [Chelativorans sp. ZYF759]
MEQAVLEAEQALQLNREHRRADHLLTIGRAVDHLTRIKQSLPAYIHSALRTAWALRRAKVAAAEVDVWLLVEPGRWGRQERLALLGHLHAVADRALSYEEWFAILSALGLVGKRGLTAHAIREIHGVVLHEEFRAAARLTAEAEVVGRPLSIRQLADLIGVWPRTIIDWRQRPEWERTLEVERLVAGSDSNEEVASPPGDYTSASNISPNASTGRQRGCGRTTQHCK